MHNLLVRASHLVFSIFSVYRRVGIRQQSVPAQMSRATSPILHPPSARVPSLAVPMRCCLQRPARSAAAPNARTSAVRPVRVLRTRDGATERLAIVGRMAEVCAELDRLAARESLC